VFPTLAIGEQAQKVLLFSGDRGYNKLSLVQAMNRYAPSNDKGKGVPKGGNQPNKYASYIAKVLGISTSVILEKLTPVQQEEMIKAMEVYEGFKVGKVTVL
jgi:hypothetical protein